MIGGEREKLTPVVDMAIVERSSQMGNSHLELIIIRPLLLTDCIQLLQHIHRLGIQRIVSNLGGTHLGLINKDEKIPKRVLQRAENLGSNIGIELVVVVAALDHIVGQLGIVVGTLLGKLCARVFGFRFRCCVGGGGGGHADRSCDGEERGHFHDG